MRAGRTVVKIPCLPNVVPWVTVAIIWALAFASGATAEPTEEIDCLALNIYWEAKTESIVGQQAVAHVTLNRVRSPQFPNSICAVVHQGWERGRMCQFSWYCDGRTDLPHDDAAWEAAVGHALNAVDGESSDPTNGALFFHALSVQPGWTKHVRHTKRIGQHDFYR